MPREVQRIKYPLSYLAKQQQNNGVDSDWPQSKTRSDDLQVAVSHTGLVVCVLIELDKLTQHNILTA